MIFGSTSGVTSGGAAISNVRYNNVVRMEERIEKAFAAINKLGDTQSCYITDPYLRLKVQELHLAHELEDKKQAEKEEQREIRARMREEALAEKEFEKAQQAAEDCSESFWNSRGHFGSTLKCNEC